jgi:long-chain acyl-CoA synthetase
MVEWGPVQTLPRLLLDRLARDADQEILYEKKGGRWVATTGGRSLEETRALALALAALGIGRGDRVAVIGETCGLWSLVDLSTLAAGGVTVGVYTTSSAPQVAYVLGHAGAKAVFYDRPEQRAKIDAARAARPGSPEAGGQDLSALAHVFAFEEVPRLLGQGDAIHARDPGAFERLIAAGRPEDLATIIYTSGTTGPPKGAMLTHANIVSVIESLRAAMPLGPEDIGVAFLPLAHSLQRVAGYAGMAYGVRGAIAESIEKLPENWREIRPTVQASVPRIWEKAYARIQNGLATASPRRRALFAWALGVGREMARFRKEGRESEAPLALRAKHALADLLVYRRVRAVFGGRVKFLTSGGAPIGADLLEFFYALGILILEGWGLTETAAPATINLPGAFRFGTVGRAIPGTEVTLAEDGELLVRGPGVFKGYYRDEAATREAFTEDGFFRTGDIGLIDAEGYVRITDRKKSLIVTSAGKKIAPANVEAAIKAQSALVSQVYVHGDRRSWLAALVTLDPEESARAADPAAEVARAVEAANRTLARYEQVKRWRIVEREFTQEDGLLTPTLKQKRKAIEARYAAEIDALYAEGAGERAAAEAQA